MRTVFGLLIIVMCLLSCSTIENKKVVENCNKRYQKHLFAYELHGPVKTVKRSVDYKKAPRKEPFFDLFHFGMDGYLQKQVTTYIYDKDVVDETVMLYTYYRNSSHTIDSITMKLNREPLVPLLTYHYTYNENGSIKSRIRYKKEKPYKKDLFTLYKNASSLQRNIYSATKSGEYVLRDSAFFSLDDEGRYLSRTSFQLRNVTSDSLEHYGTLVSDYALNENGHMIQSIEYGESFNDDGTKAFEKGDTLTFIYSYDERSNWTRMFMLDSIGDTLNEVTREITYY